MVDLLKWMATVLEDIVRTKEVEVRALKARRAPQKSVTRDEHVHFDYPFETSLRDPSKAPVIAEIKRRSPSAGSIAAATSERVTEIARLYEASNAACISVLTDTDYFGGSIADLSNVASCVQIPVIRKDFVIDEAQIDQAKEAGAAAVLLIVAVLKGRTAHFVNYCYSIGIECLVEVHNEEELAISIQSKARIIGVNNRNLHTFATDLITGEKLVKQIPEGILKVAESGIKTVQDAERMLNAGFDAVLVGEALMKSTPNEITAFLSALRPENRE